MQQLPDGDRTPQRICTLAGASLGVSNADDYGVSQSAPVKESTSHLLGNEYMRYLGMARGTAGRRGHSAVCYPMVIKRPLHGCCNTVSWVLLLRTFKTLQLLHLSRGIGTEVRELAVAECALCRA